MLERDAGFLWDILEAARKLVRHLEGVTWTSFRKDEIRQHAVAHLVQIIGEAASRVSMEFQEAHPEVQWQEIIGMRHKIVHDYRDLRLSVLWTTAKDDVPALITLIEPLIPPPPEEPA